MMGSFCTIDCGPPPPTRDYRDMVPAPYIDYRERMRQAWLDFYEWEDEMAWQEYMDCFEAFGNLIDNYFETIDWEILLEEWDSENGDSEIVYEEEVSEDWDAELLW